LTGDQQPEYIFESIGTIRTNREWVYSIYQLNKQTQSLDLMNLAIRSDGIIGECDTIFGEMAAFQVIESEVGKPVVKVKEWISICDEQMFEAKNEKVKNSYYQWDDEQNRFVLIDFK